jgi:uncharacterized repeat protein (TIGR03943 family)
VRRETQGLALLLLGGAILRAGLTDVYLRYVKAGLRPLLLIAGAVLIAVALATFWYEARAALAARRRPLAEAEAEAGAEAGAGAEAEAEAGAEAGDGHGHREPRIAWLLALPVLALVAIVPPPLGSYTADRTGTGLQPGLAVDDVPRGDPAVMDLASYAEVAAYEHGKPLAGRRVHLSGFITVDSHGSPYLTRMVISCCAADGVPVKVGLAGQLPPGLRPDLWLDVIGAYNPTQTTDAVNGGPIPYLTVLQATPIPAPADPYDS